jgi:hypothetical protein
MRIATTILGCLMAVALAGCGSSASTSGPSGAAPSSGSGATATAASAGSTGTPGAVGGLPDACSLLTTGEIEGIVGHSVAAGVVDGAASCKWERKDPTTISVGLHLLTLPGSLKCQTGGSTPVDGLGVEAGWQYLANLNTGHVVACPSGRQVQITLIGDNVTNITTEDQLRADGVQLMGLVLPRL